MSTILVHVLVGLMLLLFATMAIGPLLLATRPSAQPTSSPAEDRVISESPVPMFKRLRMPAEQPLPLGGERPAGRPDQREAA